MLPVNAPMENHVEDLIPGYALGCLNAVEMQQVDQHIAQCASCQADLEAYRRVAEQLYLAVPQAVPPPQVKQQLMRHIVENQPAAAPRLAASKVASRPPAGSPAGTPGAWRRWFSPSTWLAQPLALAGLLLVVLLSVSNVWLWQRVQRLEAATSAEFRVVSLAGTENAPGASAVLVMNHEGTQGTLVAADLPALDPDHQYQLWLIKDGQRTSGGVFSVAADGYGSLPLTSAQSLYEMSAFGVTIEPAGGSPGPTGARVLAGVMQ